MKRNDSFLRSVTLLSTFICFLFLVVATKAITLAANTGTAGAPSLSESAVSSNNKINAATTAGIANIASTAGTTKTPATAVATNASTGTGDLQFNLDVTASPVITRDREYCVSNLNKTVDKVEFLITGPKESSFAGIPHETDGTIKYCFKFYVSDFPDGAYKLTVRAQRPEGTASKTIDIEIRKQSTLEQIIQDAKGVLEDKCAGMGMSDITACRNKVIDEYAANIGCSGMSKEECATEIKEEYADALIVAQDKYARIKEEAKQYFGKDITVDDLERALNNGLTNPDVSVPLQEKELRVKALKVAESIAIDKTKGIIQSAPIAVTIDTDGDGIPDDIEKRLGTNPDKADTDGDRYEDAEEILGGYDPLGPGKKNTSLSPIEKAILENTTLGQPKGSGQEKDSFIVDKIENAAAENGAAEGKGYTISGKAQPNSVATLYVYSDIPIVATVTTDEYGNWQYRFEEPLSDGDHEIYIALNDNTGKVIEKSKPFGFPVQEAKAVTPADLANMNQNNSQSFNNMIYYYTFAAIILIVSGILVFLFAILRQKNKFNQQ